MNKKLALLLIAVSFFMPLLAGTSAKAAGEKITFQSNGPCQNKLFFGLEPWYRFLSTDEVQEWHGDKPFGDKFCRVQLAEDDKGVDLKSIWLIGLAVVDDMLRIVGVVALAFILYGGYQYITTQGDPERAKSARSTIINALIGALIATIAVVSINFAAGTLSQSASAHSTRLLAIRTITW